MKIKVVISAVNFTSGGPLSVLLDCLKAFRQYESIKNFEITVLIHKKNLVQDYLNDFKFIEFPDIKSSWIKRLYFEYLISRKISARIKPKIWFSLHDMTPNVNAELQYVYCHNPAPFYNVNKKEIFLDFKFYLFNLFYKYLYKINIKRNEAVIVQQNWLRSEFINRYNVKTIVAYPKLSDRLENFETATTQDTPKNGFIFFYPSFPRIFKNFEVIMEAAVILERKRNDFKLLLTIDGIENKYSRMLHNKYASSSAIEFLGKIDRDEVFNYYERASCLIFPSKLETWGLPISEFKPFNKPMLLADLPYAHETVGEYEKVKFFNPKDAKALAMLMNDLIENRFIFDETILEKPISPFFTNWENLIEYMLNQKNE